MPSFRRPSLLAPVCILLAVFLLTATLASPGLAQDETSSPAAAQDTPSSEDLEGLLKRMAKIGSSTSPSFSPDGEHIAFVSDLNGLPQVWTVPTRGGFPRLVTSLDDQVGGVSWSPVDDLLIFSLAPGGGMNQQVYSVRPDGTDLRRLTSGGQANNWVGGFDRTGRWLSVSSNRTDPGSMDVWLYDLENGGERMAVDNDGIGFLTDMHPSGTHGVVYRMVSRGDNNLYLASLNEGAEDEVLLTPHEGPGSFDGGVFSPDGRTIYLSSNGGRDLTAFGRISLADGDPGDIETLVARDDAELQGFEISHRGDQAILNWNRAGRSELQRLDLATLDTLPLPEIPAELIGNLTFSNDDRYLAMVLSGSTAPSDIWMLDVAGGDLWQVTHSPHAGVDLDTLVRPELVRFPAHDDLELSAWLYRPEGDGPFPYVLSFHGGPESQERPRFRPTYQALLKRGIGVLAPNVRGSSGFGKRFVNLDNGALRFDGIKDIEACARFLLDGGHAKAGHLGIMGGSYGGYMTMAGLAWYPDLFAAGANLFGVVNFATFFEHTEAWMAAVSKIEYGDPDTQADLLRELSPIHKLDQVKAPTLVLHGANDTNVPVVEAEQVVDHLKRRGVPVQYVLFEDEGHGFRKTANRLRMTVEIVDWFDRYLSQE